MQKERLLTLANFLDELPPENFNIGAFVSKFNEKKGCGTVCCAIGWLPQVFPNKWSWDNGHPQFDKNLHGWDGAQEFFKISWHDTRYLFSEFEYSDVCNTTPNQVAARIREFVKNNE